MLQAYKNKSGSFYVFSCEQKHWSPTASLSVVSSEEYLYWSTPKEAAIYVFLATTWQLWTSVESHYLPLQAGDTEHE